MYPDFWIVTAISTALSTLLATVGKSLKIIRWFEQRGNTKTRKKASTAAESTLDPERIFIAFLVVCGIASSVTLMLALHIYQREPPSPAITLLFCLTGSVVVSGLLFLFAGVSFYKKVKDFAHRLAMMEQQQAQNGSRERQISFNRKPNKTAGSPQEREVRTDHAIEQAKTEASISSKLKRPPPAAGRLNATNRTKTRNTRKKE